MPLYFEKCTKLILTLLVWVVSWSCTQQAEFFPPRKPQTENAKVVIAATGDIMMPLSNQMVANRDKKHYDLLFEKIAQDLTSADITVANLETPIDHTAKISGYPRFNAGPGLVAALKRAGVGCFYCEQPCPGCQVGRPEKNDRQHRFSRTCVYRRWKDAGRSWTACPGHFARYNHGLSCIYVRHESAYAGEEAE
jgi:hypothetical protein